MPPVQDVGAEMVQGVAELIDGERLWQRLMELARYGATDKGGVRRLALSQEEIAARACLVRLGPRLRSRGVDGCGSQSLPHPQGREPDLPPVLIGSHIDSQPTGGKFDGAYGVIAALEAAQAMAQLPAPPRRSVAVVAWMNEEGSRFAPGMMGSAVFTGKRNLAEVLAVRDRRRKQRRGGARRRCWPPSPCCRADRSASPWRRYLEPHIEQGPALQERQHSVGIVTGIQGKRTFRVEIAGEESHAGTTPRRRRRDALVSAVAIIAALQKRCGTRPIASASPSAG